MARRRTNTTSGLGAILIVAAIVGIIILLTRNKTQIPLQLAAGGQTPHPDGLVRYKNTETREIEWDTQNMLPVKITITRESKQL